LPEIKKTLERLRNKLEFALTLKYTVQYRPVAKG
jgi:hypothetical protein